MREVAARAGVGEATVYAAYRSKAGLARALVDTVDIAAEVAGSAQDVLDADPDPRAQLAFMIGVDHRLFERDGNLIAMLQDSRAEPELRAAYDRGRARADQIHRGVFDSWPGHWFRAGMGAADAADTYAALCNIGVYQVLTGERGWTADQVQDWWHDSLSRLLLTAPHRPPDRPPSGRPADRSDRRLHVHLRGPAAARSTQERHPRRTYEQVHLRNGVCHACVDLRDLRRPTCRH